VSHWDESDYAPRPPRDLKKEREDHLEALKNDKIRSFAEIRRILTSGESSTMDEGMLLDEVEIRAKADKRTVWDALRELKNRGELKSSFGEPIEALNVKAPDEEHLSDFEVNFIPEGTQDRPGLGTLYRSPVNDERAILTQRTIQRHLKSGSTIVVRHADGTEEEIDFIIDPVERTRFYLK